MNERKLNEAIEKFMEDQIEGDPTLQAVEAIKQDTFEEGDPVEVVVNNLDEFSVRDLVNILSREGMNYAYRGLFPSQWDEKYGAYPVQLAKALTLTIENESVTDIYNVFYKGKDEALYERAIEIWKEDALGRNKETSKMILDELNDRDYPEDLQDFLGLLDQHYPEFVEKLRELV